MEQMDFLDHLTRVYTTSQSPKPQSRGCTGVSNIIINNCITRSRANFRGLFYEMSFCLLPRHRSHRCRNVCDSKAARQQQHIHVEYSYIQQTRNTISTGCRNTGKIPKLN